MPRLGQPVSPRSWHYFLVKFIKVLSIDIKYNNKIVKLNDYSINTSNDKKKLNFFGSSYQTFIFNFSCFFTLIFQAFPSMIVKC